MSNEALGANRWRRIGLVPLFVILFGLTGIGALLFTGANSSATPTVIYVRGSGPGCSVELAIHSTYAHAEILSGCTGGNYWLASWQAQSATYGTSFPQYLLKAVNSDPWNVPLPTTDPCFDQVDFSYRTSPPGTPATTHQVIATHLGAVGSCPTPTTLPQSTTTTTQPGSTTTTTTQPGATTTTTQPGATTTTQPGSTTTTTQPSSTTTTTQPGSTTTTTRPGSTTTTTAPPELSSTTTTAAHTGPGSNPTTTIAHFVTPPTNPKTGPNSSGGNPSSGGLAFTGFAVLMIIFIGSTLIGAGMAVVRMSRAGYADS